MNIQWDISLASLVTWAVMVGSAIWAVSKMTTLLNTLIATVGELKGDFKKHEEHDDKRFERINDNLLRLAQEKK